MGTRIGLKYLRTHYPNFTHLVSFKNLTSGTPFVEVHTPSVFWVPIDRLFVGSVNLSRQLRRYYYGCCPL